MKSAGAVLLDISASKTSGSGLQKILETAFSVTVPPQLPRHILQSSAVLEEALTQTIRRALIIIPAAAHWMGSEQFAKRRWAR